MRRQSLLAAASLALVMGAAAPSALAQAVPVSLGMNPAAYPDLAKEAAYTDRPAKAEPGAPAALSFEPEPVSRATAPLTVTVAAGDTVYALSRRHGVAPNEIIAANGMTPPYTLSLGQTLTIPGASAAAPDGAPTADPIVAATVVAPEAPVEAEPKTGLLRSIERVDEEGGAVATASVPATPSADGKLDAIYAVRRGDTLYSLARRFEVPLAELAEANGLSAPYGLSLGQSIVVPKVVPAPAEQASQVADAPTVTAPAATAAPEALPFEASVASRFAWPIRGAIVSSYGSMLEGVRNDGINIAAPAGAPVRAAGDGEVVYRGDELAGYGNLLLIKHGDGWVSAYAHAGSILVRKGDRVTRGQVVARVGDTGSVNAPQLHFELRHDLRPQDPIAALNGTLRTASLQR